MPKPIAIWSPTHDCWLASDDETESLFSVPSAVYSETFPTSGMWADGTAYALPTSEPHMDDSASSSLLRTPAVNDMGEGKTVERWDEWTDDMQAKHGNGNGHGKSLAIEAQRLLPTPEGSDGSGGRKSAELGGFRESGAKRAITLATAVDHAEWGDYAAAIARWESTLGRPAPAPTMTSIKGNPQLSPAFVEWLMGLPIGWVTDAPGITRNEALKALGNGVVPQQAEAAIRFLMTQEAVA